MAGIGALFSSGLRRLVDGLEAGTEEGVRAQVEEIREDERREEEGKTESYWMKAERMRREDEEWKERERLEEETKTRDERIRIERQKSRDEKTAFWTTPGLRPLAEPPILDWGCFFRSHIPSDLRYRALFPNDPGKISRMKDLDGELAVLHEYTYCTGMSRDDPEADSRREEFYDNMYQDIHEDLLEVQQEYDDIWRLATPLSQFEYLLLDNDGRTTHLEQWIAKGADIFYNQTDDVREKYSHLVPRDFIENRPATFEFHYIDRDGFKSSALIRRAMREGRDILIGWPQEIQSEYGHLRRLLPRPPPFEPGTPASVRSDYLPKADDISRSLRDSHPTTVRRASFHL